MRYAIEMFDVDQDYGTIHKAGCRDLRDPMDMGTDWREGIDGLGWGMEPEEFHVAPCAR